MRDRSGDEVRLQLPDGSAVFRFDIAAGENAILPFGIMLAENVKLDWATAQPLAHMGDTWFFLAPDGMRPVYCVNGQIIGAEVNGAFTAGGQTVMTISRKDSLGFSLHNDKAWLCEKPLLWMDGRPVVELYEGSARVRVWNEKEKRFVLCAAIDSGRRKRDVRLLRAGNGRWTAELNADELTGHKQVLLRVRYQGDIGHAFVNGSLISDNMCSGADWDIRLDHCAGLLKTHLLTLYITPARKSVVVETSAMAGLKERAETDAAEIFSAELLTIDDFPVNCP